jgi:hypothetical protein
MSTATSANTDGSHSQPAPSRALAHRDSRSIAAVALALTLAAAGIWMLGEGGGTIASLLRIAQLGRSRGPIAYGSMLSRMQRAVHQAGEHPQWLLTTAANDSTADLCKRLSVALRGYGVSVLLVHATENPVSERATSCQRSASRSDQPSPARYLETKVTTLLGVDTLRGGGFALADSSFRVVYSSAYLADIDRLLGIIELFDDTSSK